MSLKRTRVLEVTAYGSAVAAASGIGGLARICGCSNNSFGGSAVYHYGRDRVYTLGQFANAADLGLFRLDPEFFMTAPGQGVGALDQDPLSGAWNLTFNPHLTVGQFNPLTGSQALYLWTGSSRPAWPINPDTLAAGSVFSTANGDLNAYGGDIASSADGGWTNGTLGRPALLFEHVTDGIPGETVLVGTNVYPSGLMLVYVTNGTIPGQATEAQFWGWVNLANRRLVGRLGGISATTFPAAADTVSGVQVEPPIAGDTLAWAPGGFTPDPDSTDPRRPKGEIFFHAARYLPALGLGTPAPGTTMRLYVRLSDFNPFGLPSANGVPSRTHGRIRLTSRLLGNVNPLFGQAGASFVESGTTAYYSPFWDPTRRRFGWFLQKNAISGFTATVGENYLGLFSTAVDPVVVSSPAPRGVPRTADVVEFESFVGGDLAEPAIGQSVAFTLTRRSTQGELLVISGGIGTTSSVANAPIDTDSGGVPELTIVANGVPLVLTTDYTVVAASGVITWVTSQAGKTVLASYAHRGVGAVPPAGTLLSSQGQTDENGIVRTQVRYADDDTLVGRLEALESTLA